MNNKNFTRNPESFPLWPNGEPQVLDTEQGRFYHDETKGVKLPSITTVLSKTKDTAHLEAWRNRIGHEAADWETRTASDKGTRTHGIVEAYLTNSLHSYADYLPTTKANFISIKKYLDKIDKIRYIETPLINSEIGIAGRVDIIGEFDGVDSIIDIKTSKKQKRKEWIEDYFLQTTGYSLMHEYMTGVKIDQLVVIMAVHSDQPQIFVENKNDYVSSLKERIERFKNV